MRAVPDRQPPNTRLSNTRLAWLLGLVALGVFLLALWQYRP